LARKAALTTCFPPDFTVVMTVAIVAKDFLDVVDLTDLIEGDATCGTTSLKLELRFPWSTLPSLFMSLLTSQSTSMVMSCSRSPASLFDAMLLGVTDDAVSLLSL
jgi:hypothetical protein